MALMLLLPPRTFPRGYGWTMWFVPACGVVTYPQSAVLPIRVGQAGGTDIVSGPSAAPASTRSTRTCGSSESRAASTQPALPAPTIT
jgi:hypothetical protein